MKMYVAHSGSFDYQNELYKPIRTSNLNGEHEITLPHEQSKEQFNSREYLKSCDLLIDEVSFPSTGQGIELGWADLYGVPIICIHKKETKPSGAIKVVSNIIRSYHDKNEMIDIINDEITKL